MKEDVSLKDSEFTDSEPSNKLNYETLKKILDNSYDEIFVVDREGTVIYVNEACERHYGLKPEDVIGKSASELSQEGFWFPVVYPYVVQEKKRVTMEQTTNIGKMLINTSTPVFNDNNEVELIVQNSRDITQIEETKHDLEETKKLLEKYKQEVQELRKKELDFGNFVAQSKQMKDVLELANRVGPVDSNILITGESGTGKGVLAKYIHSISSRKEGPFISINCAAIPDELLESELFGYVPGAFTGAVREGKVGLIELANDGTLFLDEIAEIPLRLQAKLLEVIQDLEFISVGGREKKKINARIIAATNRKLENMVKDGQFREDLYYRLKVIEIEIPALRERPDDILPLAHFFLSKFDGKYKQMHNFSSDCLDFLIGYSWPGNIRELENLVERLAVTVQNQIIEPSHLPKSYRQNEAPKVSVSFPAIVPLEVALEQAQKELIVRAHEELKSSYKVATALNISQSKASRLIRKYIAD